MKTRNKILAGIGLVGLLSSCISDHYIIRSDNFRQFDPSSEMGKIETLQPAFQTIDTNSTSARGIDTGILNTIYSSDVDHEGLKKYIESKNNRLSRIFSDFTNNGSFGITLSWLDLDNDHAICHSDAINMFAYCRRGNEWLTFSFGKDHLNQDNLCVQYDINPTNPNQEGGKNYILNYLGSGIRGDCGTWQSGSVTNSRLTSSKDVPKILRGITRQDAEEFKDILLEGLVRYTKR